MVSAVFYWQGRTNVRSTKKGQPIHFTTSAGQQKVLTLRDGTKIRLAGHSQLWISGDYGRPSREVTLKGKAYFEVNHSEAHPFVVHAGGALIKDLGTAFNVRVVPGKRNVQVAVKKGKVSIYLEQGGEEQAIELVGGQFGFLNLETGSVSIDSFATWNYLSWINGRIRFHNAPLAKVSEQLSRIYNVSFKYDSESLAAMRLSAEFERGSLRKALAVISLTLSIDYQIKNHHVIWRKKKE